MIKVLVADDEPLATLLASHELEQALRSLRFEIASIGPTDA
jgi:hypothetical protein